MRSPQTGKMPALKTCLHTKQASHQALCLSEHLIPTYFSRPWQPGLNDNKTILDPISKIRRGGAALNTISGSIWSKLDNFLTQAVNFWQIKFI
jgi:hypothetical protein